MSADTYFYHTDVDFLNNKTKKYENYTMWNMTLLYLLAINSFNDSCCYAKLL